MNPLDRPVWYALRTHQAHVATTGNRARRMNPDFGIFAASRDDDPESLAELAELVPKDGAVLLLQAGTSPPPPGTIIQMASPAVQMIAQRLVPLEPDHRFRPLEPEDVQQMLALSALTQPGPFFARTNELGQFWGAHADGKLVAMAGERLRFDEYVEVSGICTHPDFRGRGYAGLLSRLVATRISKLGKIPILHAVASNTQAIRLYETLGFDVRSKMTASLLTPSVSLPHENLH